MIFMAKVCPKAINFAIAESIHQLLVLRPHPIMRIVVCLHLTQKRAFSSYKMEWTVSQPGPLVLAKSFRTHWEHCKSKLE